MNYVKRIIYLLTILGAAVYLYYKWDDLGRLLDLKISSIVILVLAALAPIFVNGIYFFKAVKEYDIRPGLNESIGLTAINSMYAYILPIKSGLVVRAYYLKRKYDFSYPAYFSFLAGNYVIGFGVAFLAASLLSSYFWMEEELDLTKTLLIVTIFPAYLIGLYILDKIDIPIEKIRYGLLRKIKETTSSIRKFKTNRNLLLQTIVVQVSLIFVNALRLYLAFVLLGFEVSAVHVLTVQILLNLSLFVSITPGNLGIREGIIAFSAGFLSLTTDEALLIAVVDRAAILVVVFLLGLVYSRILLKNDTVQTNDIKEV